MLFDVPEMNTLFRISLASGLMLSLGFNSCESVGDTPMPSVPAAAKKTYISSYLSEGERRIPVKSDAIELESRYQTIFKQIDDEVSKALRYHPKRNEFGFSHTFEAKKREILWKKYGIDWHPVSALNPNILID